MSIIILIVLLFYSLDKNLDIRIFQVSIFTATTIRMLPLTYNIYNSLGAIWNCRFALDRLKEIIIKLQTNKINFKIDKTLNEINKFEIKKIHFRYDKNKQYIFEKVNLEFNKGTLFI